VFAWYDLWFGAYWDRKKQELYLMIPFIGMAVRFLGHPEQTMAEEIERLRDLCGDAEHWLTVPPTTSSDRDCVAVLCRKLCEAAIPQTGDKQGGSGLIEDSG
jgi:hypothetical protein